MPETLPHEYRTVLSALGDGQPHMLEALSERTHRLPFFLRPVLTRLAEAGLAERNDRGEWLVTEAGHEWLAAHQGDPG